MKQPDVPHRPFAERFDIEADLRVTTPLHIGTGAQDDDDAIEKVLQPDGEEESVASARIVRDHAGAPYIPGASLRGVLRAALERAIERLADKNLSADALFGTIKDANGKGHMGPLIVYGAAFKSAPPASARPAYAGKGRGVALSARTALQAGRGTVERHKLFHAEEVVPGTVFSFRARLLAPVGDDDAGKAQRLCGILRHLLDTDGLAMGRSTADGAGRLDVEKLTVTSSKILATTGRMALEKPARQLEIATDDKKKLETNAAPVAFPPLTLTAQGPFFVDDWSWNSKTEAAKTGVPKNKTLPQLKALRGQPAAGPILPGTSLMGVLRARAAWLAALKSKRGESTPEVAKAAINDLFGTTKQRARLQLARLVRTNSGAAMEPTSVRLDRFSGAPIEGALFGVSCFAGCVFEADFTLDVAAGGAAEALAKDLSGDLIANGLRLGHAGNRGFGWFKVKERA